MKHFNLEQTFKALKIVWNSSHKWSLVNFIFIVLKGITPLLMIFVVQLLVDKVVLCFSNQESFTVYSPIFKVLYFAVGVFILNAVLNSLGGIVSEKHSFFIEDVIQDLIHERTTNLDLENFDDVNFQNVYYRAINEATFRPKKIYYGFVSLFQTLITLLLIAGLFAQLSVYLVLFLILTSVPIVFVRLKYSHQIFHFKRKYTEEERVVGYYNRLLTGKEFAKELRLFNLSKCFKFRFEKQKDGLRASRFSLLKRKTLFELVIQIVIALSLVAVFGYISQRAMEGQISQGSMVMYMLAMYRGYGYLQELLSRISSLFEDSLFLKNFFEFLEYKVVPKHQLIEFPKRLSKGIFVENLNFKYPNSSRFVFKDLNLMISPGETIALVGANGSGKSTLVKILSGLYTPQEGKVFFDNVDLLNVRKESLAENISVVFQDFMLYNTSAKENIWFGNVNKSIDDDSLKKSAQSAGVDVLLENLPKGYDTRLGTLFKDSEMLSVGEWQRIALARSFFNDAQLVILDEPTSSMDAYTESRLIENFKAIVKDRTAIIVSHRLSTIHLADRIIVLGHHGIEEDGSFEELITKKGVFYKMFSSLSNTIK